MKIVDKDLYRYEGERSRNFLVKLRYVLLLPDTSSPIVGVRHLFLVILF